MYCNCRAIIERETPQGREVLVQKRNKPYEGQPRLELPGGRVEEYEALINALRREVREETGLELSYIEGQETRIETDGEAVVECLRPFAVYQTLAGPVDSIGVYFRCRGEGQLLEAGDETLHTRWMSISDIAGLLNDTPEQFSFVDRAGLNFYILNCL